MNIYQIKKEKYFNSNENMLFSRKTDKTIWKPPFSKRIPPPPTFQLTSLVLNNFLMTPRLVQILKIRTPLILGGRKLCMYIIHELYKLNYLFSIIILLIVNFNVYEILYLN